MVPQTLLHVVITITIQIQIVVIAIPMNAMVLIVAERRQLLLSIAILTIAL